MRPVNGSPWPDEDGPGPEVELSGPGYAEAPPFDPLKALEGQTEDLDLETLEVLLRRLGAVANGQDPLSVELLRERAMRALRGKVGPRGRLLDAVLRASRSDGGGSHLQGQEMALEPPEPWPEPVDGALLLDELVLTFGRFLALPDGAAAALALWVLHAHAHDSATVSPLLALCSPEKRCGKTTTLTLLGALVPKPLPASNITPAALFRAVERFSPTLLVDEADSFLNGDREELRGVLNSGHTRSLAYVVRTVGEEHEPRKFSTWAPKAVALIGKLPATLEDRSVVLPLRRKAPGETVERLRLDRLGALEGLRRQAARWAADHAEVLGKADPPTPPELHDRAADNWRPLLAVADLAGGSWPETARRAARVLSAGEAAEDSSIRVELLSDLWEIFEAQRRERIFTGELLEALHGRDDRPWGEWGRSGKPITGRGVARLLKPFGVSPRQVRVGDTTGKGYRLEDLEDPFRRYLPGSQTKQAKQPKDGGGLPASPIRNAQAGVSDREPPEGPVIAGGVSDVSAGRTLSSVDDPEWGKI